MYECVLQIYNLLLMMKNEKEIVQKRRYRNQITPFLEQQGQLKQGKDWFGVSPWVISGCERCDVV